MRFTNFLIPVAGAVLLSLPAQARDYVSVAGSSTVLPFATIVAEAMGKNPNFKTPVVEAGGSSVGKKSVCEGIGTEFIDFGNASSRMKEKELAFCDQNGVDLTEIKVGYDGIVVANSKSSPVLNISRHDLGMALTAEVPDPKYPEDADLGTWIPNPYKKWSDINASYPDIEIRVYGPPTTSGTRASFAEMINQKSYCAKNAKAKALSAKRSDPKGKKCRAMRTDGAYIEAGEQDNLIVQKLREDANTFGIFGFSYLDQNSDTIQGAVLDGVTPTFEAIGSGAYKASRALYIYAKHAHMDVVPGMREYMTEWTKHWGNDGILSDAGMIPMSKEERATFKDAMTNLPKLTVDMLQ